MPNRGFAVVTSRASHELVYKAAQFGIHTLAVISAPTAAAVTFAEEAGMTLIGFAANGAARCTRARGACAEPRRRIAGPGASPRVKA